MRTIIYLLMGMLMIGLVSALTESTIITKPTEPVTSKPIFYPIITFFNKINLFQKATWTEKTQTVSSFYGGGKEQFRINCVPDKNADGKFNASRHKVTYQGRDIFFMEQLDCSEVTTVEPVIKTSLDYNTWTNTVK